MYKGNLIPSILNTISSNKHVRDVEISISTINEWLRSTIRVLPFRKHPTIMILKLVGNTTTGLNTLSAMDGISDRTSTKNIMTGEVNVKNKKLKIEFGNYTHISRTMDQSTRQRCKQWDKVTRIMSETSRVDTFNVTNEWETIKAHLIVWTSYARSNNVNSRKAVLSGRSDPDPRRM